MKSPLHILISNDDGIHAPGILNLIEVAAEFGDVSVVAPSGPQSGMGHAISIGKPLRIYEEDLPHGRQGFAVSGTPADCIKIATGVLLDHSPDLILSGINHGSNASVSSIYSGTLSAAREGAIQGIPSIGFSLNNFQHSADMSASQQVVRSILKEAIEHPLPKGHLLNVNIPDLPTSEIKGIKLTTQARGRWIEEFDERVDPFGRKYYWLTGAYELQDDREDTDILAMENGFVSVTPQSHDLTDYDLFSDLKKWSFDLN